MSNLGALELENAIKRYLDKFYEADRDGDRIPWPEELERLTGWESSDE